MRPGARLGIDVGTVRVGVAVCDPQGLMATPVETVRRGGADVDRVAALAAEHAVIEIVVGWPRSMSGGEGPSARAARRYAASLAARVAPISVRLVDERLTTVSAERRLRAAGVRARQGRSVVDQAAAVVILQSALDAERSSGRPPGQIVTGDA